MMAQSLLDTRTNEQTLPLPTRRDESQRASSLCAHLYTEFSGFWTQAEALTVTTSYSSSLASCTCHLAVGSVADLQAPRSQLSLPGWALQIRMPLHDQSTRGQRTWVRALCLSLFTFLMGPRPRRGAQRTTCMVGMTRNGTQC